jgi:hypothetical protein
MPQHDVPVVPEAPSTRRRFLGLAAMAGVVAGASRLLPWGGGSQSDQTARMARRAINWRTIPDEAKALLPGFLPEGYLLSAALVNPKNKSFGDPAEARLLYWKSHTSGWRPIPLTIVGSRQPHRGFAGTEHRRGMPVEIKSARSGRTYIATYFDGCWVPALEGGKYTARWSKESTNSLVFATDAMTIGIRGERYGAVELAELVSMAESVAP